MAARADNALRDGSWLVQPGISVKLEQSLQQDAGGSGVAFGHALFGQAGTRGIRRSDHEALRGAAQALRIRRQPGDHLQLILRQLRERSRIGVEAHVQHRLTLRRGWRVLSARQRGQRRRQPGVLGHLQIG